ncbi:hypothetical protein T265_00789 [Opisthorchis viverrini]|uniref:Uncharacterized protein n=1 Tax=Opisthorchis viverrini TaxID=6198 RepID=A0A075A4T3_OPIVI|nr:hypothetical protein T265_00789 [Opisthorchis viverrini]KER33287.1 hypothetical protein T265_00789 [Opisthorchis viverrini]
MKTLRRIVSGFVHLSVYQMSGIFEPVALLRCLAAMPLTESTSTRILPGCASLDRRHQEADDGFESRAFRSINSRSNH